MNSFSGRSRFGVAFCTLLATGALACAPASAEPSSRTLGFVVDEIHHGTYETPEKKECPTGMQYSNRDNWLAKYKTPEEQYEFLRRFGTPQNRGPNGENAWIWPTSVKDTLPFKELQSKVAIGLNLDGDTSGAAGPKTCTHENFTDAAGKPGVDNQLYRVIGCLVTARKSGMWDEWLNRDLKDTSNRILIEITEVDDAQNDPDVIVSYYKGRDNLPLAAGGKPLPWATQTVDARYPQYINRTRGRIENGVLKTEPGFVRFPMNNALAPGDFRILDARLELKLADARAEGFFAGYQDIEGFWKNLASALILTEPATKSGSGPTMYAALKRFADGHKDPKTGQCTSISSAFDFTATAAMIAHETDETRAGAQKVAKAN